MQFRFAAAVFVILSPIASSASADTLQPIEKWGIDYGISQCTAVRTFGTEAVPVILGIVPAINGQTYQILIQVPRQGPVFAKDYRGTADFGSGPVNNVLLHYGAKGVNQSNYQYRLSAADVGKARNATSATFSTGDGQTMTFVLSDMGPLIDGLVKCNSDLQAYWNLSGASLKTAAAKVSGGDVRRILTYADYPPDQQIRHDRGTSQFQLLVDDKGAVERCDVVATSDNPTFEAAACSAFQNRAHFTPATDVQGKPVRSVVTTQPVSWRAAGNALNGGCNMVSSDGGTMMSSCNSQPTMMRVQTENPPPPPPPPPSGK